MPHRREAWRAAECTVFGNSEVIQALQRESPHERFVLGGLAALAVSIKDARDDGHALPVAAELANTLIPTLYAPIIVHLPSTLSATVAAHNQKDFAEGADHAELSTDLRQPFETSAFSHPFSTIAGDEGGEIECHLKFSPFPLDHSTHPRLYDSLVHVVNVGFATHLSYLSPWAVAAEHLVLGALVNAAFAAAYMVRLAVSVGTQMASAAAAGAGRRLGADEAATLLGEALDGMLGARGGRAVLETWIERFGRSGWALSMQLWEERVLEVHRNELARQQHLELYERVGQFLLPVFKAAKERLLAHGVHALGKFAQAARRANERAAAFA